MESDEGVAQVVRERRFVPRTRTRTRTMGMRIDVSHVADALDLLDGPGAR